MNFVAPLWGQVAKVDYATRLAIAVVLSFGLHITAIFGVHFHAPDPNKLNNANPPLEVVLVNSKSASRPTHADALAQANLDGGGNTDLDRRAKSSLPVLNKTQPEPEEAQTAQQVQELEQRAQKLMTQLKSKHSQEVERANPQQQQEKVDSPQVAQLLKRSMEIARLEAQVSQDWDAYQKRPKRTFVGARTAEYTYARYIEDWRAKVEKVGNLNYPEEAKQQRLYGSLQLTVSIKADGTLEDVEINRSSGYKLLDQAAIRIVRLAAPYAPFSDDIRKKTDILSITRTWMFTRADQLATGAAE